MPWVAGIGSRDTPARYLRVIHRLSGSIAARGAGISSGNARGADQAWEGGAREMGGAVRSFVVKARRGLDAIALDALDPGVVERAREIARPLHGGWGGLDEYARGLMTRNVLILLGPDLETPVAGVACWAPRSALREGRVVNVAGGTGLAVRLAALRALPVLNLALEPHLDHARSWHRDPSAPLEALFEPAALDLRRPPADLLAD